MPHSFLPRICTQIDADGKVLRVYPSMNAAARAHGINSETVQRAVKYGKPTRHGLRFRATPAPATDATPPVLEHAGEVHESPHFRYYKGQEPVLECTKTFVVEWKPVIGYEAFYKIEPNAARVWSVRNKSILRPTRDGSVCLCKEGKRVMKFVHVLLYDTFHGREAGQEQWEVDHRNENHTDNSLCNLQLLPRAENLRKSRLLKPRDGSIVRASKILQVDESGKTIREFSSISEASRQLSERISYSGIWRSVDLGIAVKGMLFKYANDPDELGEEWRILREDLAETHLGISLTTQQMRVSNKGRVQIGNGSKIRGSRPRGSKKYSYIQYGGKRLGVHKLVYLVHNGTLPEHEICHNDEAPLCEDGRYRNWAVDLRDDSHSNNLKESHATGAQAASKKRKRREFDEMHNADG